VIVRLDPLLLSRLQWAWVIAWHILLPAFTVGLAAYIAVLEGLHFFTGRELWFRISSFWTRIFAVSFGMGVVSGIIMPFQFGTNWSRFSDAAGNVISPMMAYEGFMAFALEATFLGVLLFARKLVPPWAHFVAAVMVSVGTLFSSFWILATNSWMQTPRGYQVIDGRFFPSDWTDIVFNPSFPYRLLHNDSAFFVTTGFVVLGVGAWLVRRDRSVTEGQVMMRMALNLLIVLVPLQMFLGDLHGRNTLDYQPTKLAAIEGLWDTAGPMPEALFAIPDQARQRNDYEIDVPHLGSLILTHSWNGQVKGLKAWPANEWPPVWPVFFAFRIMVGIAILMFIVVVTGWALRLRGRLYDARWFLSLLEGQEGRPGSDQGVPPTPGRFRKPSGGSVQQPAWNPSNCASTSAPLTAPPPARKTARQGPRRGTARAVGPTCPKPARRPRRGARWTSAPWLWPASPPQKRQ
jgi:cytochrome bd ubiquinol oxidase subunit I